MPDKKNYNCRCGRFVDYPYSIHRTTFLHKLLSAKKINNSFIYNDSIDLDKTAEHMGLQQLQQQMKTKKTQKPSKIAALRKQCAKRDKTLAPFSKNPMAAKLFNESITKHRKDLADAAARRAAALSSDDDDFVVDPRIKLAKMQNLLHRRPTTKLPSNLPSFNDSLHQINSTSPLPLAQSTQHLSELSIHLDNASPSFCPSSPSPINRNCSFIDPPTSPVNIPIPSQPTVTNWCLQRISFPDKDCNLEHHCNGCKNNINYTLLAQIPTFIPPGRQVLCAPCLLRLSSSRRDPNVEFFHKLSDNYL
jgi:hypothetical protein